jgi:hypothetical protein
VLDLFFSHASNGATFTDLDRQHLHRINYQPAEESAANEEVTAAQTHTPGTRTASESTAAKGHDPAPEQCAHPLSADCKTDDPLIPALAVVPGQRFGAAACRGSELCSRMEPGVALSRSSMRLCYRTPVKGRCGGEGPIPARPDEPHMDGVVLRCGQVACRVLA